MKKFNLFLLLLIPLVLALTGVIPVHAQTSPAKPVLFAEVDRTNISTDDTIILTVTVDMFEASLSKPQMPALTGFEVIGRNNATQISMLNGDMTVQETYQYYLRPVKTGELIIEPITLSVYGSTYSTDPIVIQASQGTGNPNPLPQSSRPSSPNLPAFPNFPSLPNFPSIDAGIPFDSQPMDPVLAPAELAGRDYFLEAGVDNLAPYQGEQVLYTVRFYTAVSPINQPEYIEPSFTGFWHETVPEEKYYSLQFEKHAYNVIELQTILFPTVVGDVQIPPAQIRIPADIFNSGGTLSSQSLPLSVKILPDNPPTSFNGAIGNFNIQTQVDTDITNVDEPVTYKVLISGSGNIENIAEPDWNEGPDWRSFDTTTNSSTQFESGDYSGTIVFERLLLPTRSGTLKIPSIDFSFFDPSAGSYQTISTQPIDITVQTDGNSASNPSNEPNSESEVLLANPIVELNKIKVPSNSSMIGNGKLISSPIYWLLFTIPLFLFIGFSAWRHYSIRYQNDADYRIYKGAAKKAHRSLMRAGRNPNQASSSAVKVLVYYLSEKMNQRLAGLTLDELSVSLRSVGLKDDLLDQVQNCIMLGEMGSYSPDNHSVSSKELIQQIEDLISKLDREL